mmetsp:Transcript_5612/g.22167  ORF Transcript_5612/g.22167 Transcript_5612/m.22167 type:complete len:330 (-) Transcript_5612:1030-2019(-)
MTPSAAAYASALSSTCARASARTRASRAACCSRSRASEHCPCSRSMCTLTAQRTASPSALSGAVSPVATRASGMVAVHPLTPAFTSASSAPVATATLLVPAPAPRSRDAALGSWLASAISPTASTSLSQYVLQISPSRTASLATTSDPGTKRVAFEMVLSAFSRASVLTPSDSPRASWRMAITSEGIDASSAAKASSSALSTRGHKAVRSGPPRHSPLRFSSTAACAITTAYDSATTENPPTAAASAKTSRSRVLAASLAADSAHFTRADACMPPPSPKGRVQSSVASLIAANAAREMTAHLALRPWRCPPPATCPLAASARAWCRRRV